MKTTKWFPGDVRPVRTGVYLRNGDKDMTAYVTPIPGLDTSGGTALSETPHTWYSVPAGQEIEIRQPSPTNNIVFYAGTDSPEVGRFEIVDGQMRFTGNCDETAKVMIEVFTKQFNDRIEADKKAVREQALLDAMNATRAFGKTGEVIAAVIRGLK